MGETPIVSDEEDQDLLAELDVEPVTTRQNSCEWHLGRMFSFTSSGSDRAIALYNGDEPELKSPSAWKLVKEFKRRYKKTGTASGTTNPAISPIQIPERIQASITKICSAEEGKDASEALKAKIDNGEIGTQEIELYLQALGANFSTAKDRNRRNKEMLVK